MLLYQQNYDYLGSSWSLFPPHNGSEMNLVSGVGAVSSRLLQLLLTRKGEDPLYVDLGVAPDLFAPKSSYSPHYFTHYIEEEINHWNNRLKMGMDGIRVDTIDDPTEGEISIFIEYGVTSPYNARELLTFGYWQYLSSGEGFQSFLDSVSLGRVER